MKIKYLLIISACLYGMTIFSGVHPAVVEDEVNGAFVKVMANYNTEKLSEFVSQLNNYADCITHFIKQEVIDSHQCNGFLKLCYCYAKVCKSLIDKHRPDNAYQEKLKTIKEKMAYNEMLFGIVSVKKSCDKRHAIERVIKSLFSKKSTLMQAAMNIIDTVTKDKLKYIKWSNIKEIIVFELVQGYKKYLDGEEESEDAKEIHKFVERYIKEWNENHGNAKRCIQLLEKNNGKWQLSEKKQKLTLNELLVEYGLSKEKKDNENKLVDIKKNSVTKTNDLLSLLASNSFSADISQLKKWIEVNGVDDIDCNAQDKNGNTIWHLFVEYTTELSVPDEEKKHSEYIKTCVEPFFNKYKNSINKELVNNDGQTMFEVGFDTGIRFAYQVLFFYLKHDFPFDVEKYKAWCEEIGADQDLKKEIEDFLKNKETETKNIDEEKKDNSKVTQKITRTNVIVRAFLGCAALYVFYKSGPWFYQSIRSLLFG